MKLITIQLRTKTKILTKYVVNPYFYDVILWMIFWNMKYLFYNFLLLLLCCACCKFAIQPFMQEDRQAIQTKLAKDWQMDCYPSLFYRELQKHYGILPQSPTAIPTECYSSVFYQELQNNYGPCHIHRRIYRRIHRRMMHIPTRTTVRLLGQSAQLPTDEANPMCACSDTQLPTVLPTDVEKSGGIFKNLVRISKQYRWKYQRDLMPPPKKILFYFPSVIPSVNLQYKTDPPLRGSFFRDSSNFFSSPPSLLLSV